MRFKTIALCVAFFALALAMGYTAWQRTLTQQGPLQTVAVVSFAPGTGASAMAQKLEASGVIASATAFKFAARQMGVAHKLQAGDYTFEPAMSLEKVLAKIATGQTTPYSLTIPEGLTTKQVIGIIEANPDLSGTISIRPAEGALFPDTYTFARGTPRQKLLEAMSKRMDDELQKAWQVHTPMLPYNGAADLLIMASIVEKEAANQTEMPQIAGVFIHRLNKKMLLQSDPTVIYGMADYGGNIRKIDLNDPNPFNTYKNAGLPPTPIANPGRAALLAAAQPASTTALFFVSDVSRSGHIFTETYAEHLKAVKQYVQGTTPGKKTAPAAAAKPSEKAKAK